MRRKIIYLIIGVLISINVFGQDGNAKIEKINNTLYKVWLVRGSYTTNMLVSIGEDGLLLIDSGDPYGAEAVKKLLLDKWGEMPKIIINTHEHRDHFGGNVVLGKESLIIGHKILKTRLMSEQYAWDEYPEYILPDIGVTDSTTIYFNGEEILIFPLTGSHDDNDLVVWFKESNVICVGDIAYKNNFPSMDELTGYAPNYPIVVQKMIDILPDDAVIVPGHSENLTMEDLIDFHTMLKTTIPLVKAAYDDGKTREDLAKEDILKGWENYENGYISKNGYIDYIYYTLETEGKIKTILDPLYRVYKKEGIKKTIEEYFNLKRNPHDEYVWLKIECIAIGGALFALGEIEDAIEFYKLDIEERKGDPGLGWTYLALGEAYEQLDNNKEALVWYEKGLEANPNSKTLKGKVEEMKELIK